MVTNINYNEKFICELLKEVDNKIALVSTRDYKNSVYNLGINSKASDYSDFLDMHNILEKILKCHSCYEDIKIEDVVTLVKNKLNQC